MNSLRQSQNFQNNFGKDTQSKDDLKCQLPEPDHADPKDQNGSNLPNLYSSLNLIEELEYEIQQADSHLPQKPPISLHHESSQQSQPQPDLDISNHDPNPLSDTSSDHISSTILIDTSKRQEIISNIFYRDKLAKIPKIPQKKHPKKVKYPKFSLKSSSIDVEQLRNELKSKIADISSYTAGVLRLESTTPSLSPSNHDLLTPDPK